MLRPPLIHPISGETIGDHMPPTPQPELAAEVDTQLEANSATRPPRSGDVVIFRATAATVVRVASPHDPASAVDLIAYLGGKAQFTAEVEHGPGGWERKTEALERRNREAEASRLEQVPRTGLWVRFALRTEADAQFTEVIPTRAKIIQVEPDHVGRVLLDVYAPEPPTDPTISDRPIRYSIRAAHVDTANISAVRTGHPDRFEYLGEANIKPHQYDRRSVHNRLVCDGCRVSLNEANDLEVRPRLAYMVDRMTAYPQIKTTHPSSGVRKLQICDPCLDRIMANLVAAT